MTYKIAIGYNNAGSLADFTVQPRMEGLPEFPRWTTAGNGMIYADGKLLCALTWDYLDPDDLDEIMDDCGLSMTTVSSQVTIEVPEDVLRTFDQFNAIIQRPKFPEDSKFDRGKYTGPFSFPVMIVQAL